MSLLSPSSVELPQFFVNFCRSHAKLSKFVGVLGNAVIGQGQVLKEQFGLPFLDAEVGEDRRKEPSASFGPNTPGPHRFGVGNTPGLIVIDPSKPRGLLDVT